MMFCARLPGDWKIEIVVTKPHGQHPVVNATARGGYGDRSSRLHVYLGTSLGGVCLDMVPRANIEHGRKNL